MHEGCAARERGGGRGWSDEPGPVTNAIGREGFVNVLKGEPGSSGPASLCCSQGRRQPARQHTPPRGSRTPAPAWHGGALLSPTKLCSFFQVHSSPSPQVPLLSARCRGPCPHCRPGRHLPAPRASCAAVSTRPDRAAPRCDPGSQPAGQHRHRPHDPDGYVPLILLDFVK